MVQGTGHWTNTVSKVRVSLRSSLFRNSFFLLVTSFLSYALGFLFWLVVARSYPAAFVGLAAALLGTVLFLSEASTLGLPYGMIRFLPTAPDRVRLINGAMTLTGLIALGLGALFLVGLPLWTPALGFLRDDAVFALTYLVSVVAFAVSSVVDAAFVAARRSDYGLVRSTVYNGLRLPLPAVSAAGLGLFGIVFAWTAAILVSLSLALVAFMAHLYPSYRPTPVVSGIRGRGIVSYSVWNQATGLAGSAAISFLPVLVLNASGGDGPKEAAYFFAAFSIASLLFVVPTAFSTSLFVEGSHPGTSIGRDTRRVVWFSSVLLAAGLLGVVLFSRAILSMFGPDYARESYGALVLLGFAAPILLVNGLFATRLRVAKRMRPLLGITAVTSVSILAVAYVLLPILGIWGAALGFLLGHAAGLPLFWIESYRNGRPTPVAEGMG